LTLEGVLHCVQVAAATISAVAAARAMAYGANAAAPEEFEFDSSVASGKFSSVAGAGGVNYITIKVTTQLMLVQSRQGTGCEDPSGTTWLSQAAWARSDL